MSEQELINIWKSSAKHDQIKFDKAKLLIEFQIKLDMFHRSIKLRDLREITPAFLMIPFFGIMAYTIPFLISKMGAIIIIAWCIYLIFRLRSLRKERPVATSEPYIIYLKKTKAYLLLQKKLSETVLYWYILPSSIGVLLFFIGIRTEIEMRIVFTFFLMGFAITLYMLNKNVVKKEFLPRLHKIDKILQDMNV